MSQEKEKKKMSALEKYQETIIRYDFFSLQELLSNVTRF